MKCEWIKSKTKDPSMAEGQRYSGTWRFPFQAVVVKREQNELHLVVCTKSSSSYHNILAKLLIFDTPKRAFLIDMDSIIMCNDFAPFASKFKSLYWLELLRRVLYECFAIETMQKTGIEAFLAAREAFEGVCKLRPACKMLGKSPVPDPVIENIVELASKRARLRATLERMRAEISDDPTKTALSSEYTLAARDPYTPECCFTIVKRSELGPGWLDMWLDPKYGFASLPPCGK